MIAVPEGFFFEWFKKDCVPASNQAVFVSGINSNVYDCMLFEYMMYMLYILFTLHRFSTLVKYVFY